MGDSFLRQAFDAAIPDAVELETWYVALVERVPYYGGPEDGGWWGHDENVVAYKEYPIRELADKAKEAVQKLADELSAEARRAEGEACARSMDWLEARGLDADFLPEPDGPTEYRVTVSERLPEPRVGSRHYE